MSELAANFASVWQQWVTWQDETGIVDIAWDQRDPSKMKDLTKITYLSEGQAIKLDMPIIQVFEQWLLLDKLEYSFDHFH